MNTIEIAALGLSQDLERLKLSAHNLANLSTPAYKRQVAVQQPFAELMEVGGSGHGLQTQTDWRAGKLSPSARPMDLALAEGSFLLVERADGSQALTRQASLEWDAQGELRTRAGDRVLGQRGVIKQGPLERDALRIDTQGQLLQGQQVLDSLALVQLQAGVQMQSLGQGLYKADPSQWQQGRPAGVQAGQLEQSNVVSSQEMVQLMASTRHAETMVRLLQTADEMMEKAIRRFGETT